MNTKTNSPLTPFLPRPLSVGFAPLRLCAILSFALLASPAPAAAPPENPCLAQMRQQRAIATSLDLGPWTLDLASADLGRSPGKVDEAAPNVVKAAAPKEAPQNFRAGEVQLELFGTARAQDLTGTMSYGGGIGGAYFITRGLGLGGRVYGNDSKDKFVDAGEARLLLRAPLWDTIAPYGILDGRFDTALNVWSAGSGGGLELRFTENVGVFAEVIFQVDTQGKGKPEGNLGLRVAF